jgi:dCTP deaminase
MILSGDEIRERLGSDIVLDPFDPAQLNVNSYDLLLHDELLVYEEVVLDVKQPNRYRRLHIPPEGLILSPSQLYLGRTVERTETHNLVPMLGGRSSLARLGLFVHVSSGFGDAGFCGYWTLEMFAVQPIRIYPGIRICQILYHQVSECEREYTSDKYQHNQDVQPSLMYKEFGNKVDPRQMCLNFETEVEEINEPALVPQV